MAATFTEELSRKKHFPQWLLRLYKPIVLQHFCLKQIRRLLRIALELFSQTDTQFIFAINNNQKINN